MHTCLFACEWVKVYVRMHKNESSVYIHMCLFLRRYNVPVAEPNVCISFWTAPAPVSGCHTTDTVNLRSGAGTSYQYVLKPSEIMLSYLYIYVFLQFRDAHTMFF